MVASSPLYGTASVLDRILGHSNRSRQIGPGVLLNARQSATALQYAQVLEHATAVFGSQQMAEQWLGKSCRYLAGHVPLDIAGNWWGFQAVEEYLQKIEFGIYH
ncbi:MbcA/ParS/Xre antitoxin family protein [Pseudomonas asiatica]|uniref:MbcA/ParS/Xre antitoxin family protein n=2 Tax=Pseudomonas TaxID=286 RepID=UPI001CED82D3|nr:MbcA/ParS/Xre antitoxin family protein [Pseudomonas asiatica]